MVGQTQQRVSHLNTYKLLVIQYDSAWFSPNDYFTGVYSLEVIPLQTAQILLRSHQILHNVGQQNTQYLLPGILLFGNFIIISALYTIIRVYDTQPTVLVLLVLSVAVLTVFLIYLASYFGLRVTNSADFLLNCMTKKIRVTAGAKYRREDMAFIKSCRDLKFSFNGWLVIEREFFICILHDVVLNNVITLLMTY